MTHSFRDNEIFVIKEVDGRRYNATREYAMLLGYEVVRGVHRLADYDHRDIPTCAPLTFNTPNHRLNDTLQITVADGSTKTIFQFGQYTWFDTEEEREQHRKEYWENQNTIKEYNQVKNAIIEKLNQMTQEQLKCLLATM